MVVYESNHDFFGQFCIGSRLKFAWFPKKCYNSGKRIWLERGYVRTAMYISAGRSIFLDRWYTEHEFLLAKIKGDV